MDYTIKPLTDLTIFSTPTGLRKPNPFHSSYGTTLKLLGRELTMLDADEALIEVACTPHDLRLDGMLKANARVTHPGVRISFESRHGILTYATDTYSRRWSDDPPDWQINLRAIALGLEALRAVDRYGVTKRGEQYAGWKAIEATPSGMGRDAAQQIIVKAAGGDGDVLPGTDERWRMAYRMARASAGRVLGP